MIDTVWVTKDGDTLCARHGGSDAAGYRLSVQQRETSCDSCRARHGV